MKRFGTYETALDMMFLMHHFLPMFVFFLRYWPEKWETDTMKRIDAYTKNYHPYTIRIPHVYHIQDSSVYQKLPPVYHTHTMNRVVAYTKKYHRIPPVSIRIPPWGAYTTRIPPVYPQYTISIPCCTLSLAVSTVLCGFYRAFPNSRGFHRGLLSQSSPRLYTTECGFVIT